MYFHRQNIIYIIKYYLLIHKTKFALQINQIRNTNNQNFSQNMAQIKVVGHLHIVVEYIKLDQAKQPIHAHISLGDIAQIDTTQKPSGSIFNEVFLIQVPTEPARFLVNCMEGQKILGEVRYDIKPFMERDGITHSLDSQIFGEKNAKVGFAKLKLTYYSAKHGKLRVRIFHLQFHPDTIKEFKQGKVKVVTGIHAQSTEIQPFDKPFDETVQVLILNPTASLTLQVIHEKGVLASYSIHNMQESGILCPESKAYQVSLFNHKKPIGLIKYQLTWIK